MTEFSRRDFLRTVGLGASAMALPRIARGAPGPNSRPNVIFFLVDDMGWMDSTVYGSEYYDTPNMERLARRSMVFSNAYSASPLCSPTRASIVTGQHPARVGITTAVGHLAPLPENAPRYAEKAPPTTQVLLPQSRRFLQPEQYTIAEAFRDSGYRTGHIGKWHLGLNPEHWPEQQGFEFSFHGAPDPGPRSYFSPYEFPAGTVTDGPEGEYITDRVTDEAMGFIEKHQDEPFLLHLWHYSVHGPWGHKEELTKQFLDKKDPRGKQNNPIMASMLKSVDESLGRVLDKLDELGIADNTIIIFFSDNGGNVHSNTEEDGRNVPEGTRRWEMIQEWRRWAGTEAPTNNYPLRNGKGSIYEGGTRVPMMVCWPGTVEPGSNCAEVVSSVDFYPTMLQMAGVLPDRELTLDGESIVPLLKQTGKLQRDAIFCHFPHGGGIRPPGVYVRQGNWKLIRWYETNEMYPDRHELYDLAADIGETNNLAAAMPEKVRELDGLIDQFLKDTNAMVPRPNPAYDPNMQPIHGWWPQVGTTISLADGALKVGSDDTRPFIRTTDVPENTGPVTVKLRMRATGGKDGRVYWSTQSEPGFVPERRVHLNPEYDNEWHEYSARIEPASEITGLRIDPSISACQAAIDWIHICSEDGTVLKAWEFE